VAIELLCRKLGTTRIYDERGQSIGVTVLEAGPNPIVQKKTVDRDGYAALQLGFGARRPIRTTKALAGHFQKAEIVPTRHLAESRVSPEQLEQYEVGGEIKVDIFEKGQRVDVIGTSRGRGTTGVVKRYGFKVHRRTHGTHEAFRHGGSIGAGASPGRVIKGKKMAGRHGAERATTLGLEVVGVDPGRNLLLLRGAVPGHKNGLVRVRESVRTRR
jgi:large subunit ribosomal protein L3